LPQTFYILIQFLLFHRFEIMENSKMHAVEGLDGSISSYQRIHHQEGISRDASAASGNRADSIWPSGPSLSTAHRQFLYHQRRQFDDDDLLASIDRHGQSLAECLSIAESALAMVRC